MAKRRPIVLVSGRLVELPQGDSFGCSLVSLSIVTTSTSSTIAVTTDVLRVTASLLTTHKLPDAFLCEGKIICIKRVGIGVVSILGSTINGVQQTIDGSLTSLSLSATGAYLRFYAYNGCWETC